MLGSFRRIARSTDEGATSPSSLRQREIEWASSDFI